MSLTAIAALVAALALVVLVIVLVPAIFSIRRTAASVADLADLLTNELKPTIQELNAVLVELKTVGSGVAAHTDDLKKFMSALGETGEQVHQINQTVGAVTGFMNQSAAWVTGAKVAGKFLLERYLSRKMKGV